ncbi:MAG: DUF3352 domain-containing protein, partial [Planctomycetota bacterium]
EFLEKSQESNIGKMLADEKIAPLVGDLFQTARDAYSEVEDKVGLSLDELQELPAGEICFAVIAPRRKTPAFVLMIDTDEESEVVEKAVQRGRDLLSENELELETEELDDVTYEKFNIEGQEVFYFNKGGTVVLGTNQDVLDGMVERWMGREEEKIRPLKENRKFITIMNRCRGTKDVPPDLRFFADPIALAKSATRGNVAAQAGLNFLPIVGLDGFLAIGGSSIIDELEFEYVSHIHFLLSNPRAGIFEMMALKPGVYEPQPWVPEKAPAYISTSWDIQKMFAEFEKMYDSFQGEGALAEEIEDEINDELDIDFKADLIDQLSGRLTYVQWVGDDASVINGQNNAVGIGLEDPDKFMDIVDLFLEKIRDEEGEDEIEEVEHQGITFWQTPDSRTERQRERMEKRREEGRGPQMDIRLPQPCFSILDDHLIIADSPEFMKRAIETSQGESPALVDDEQFQYVSEQMTRLLGTDVPGAIIYSCPEETFKMFFNVAKNDDTRGFLDRMAEDNKYAQGVRDAIENNPLPEFEDIKQYFPPSGAFITNDDTGYHLLGFQLKAGDGE